MIYKNVAAYLAARAAHRVMAGRPFFADLDCSDPPAILAEAHREWAATTACYSADPKLYDFDVRNLLIGIEAHRQSKPSKKMREAWVFFVPLPEHITASGGIFMHQRASLVAKLARELTRRKVVTVDRALTLLRVPA
jgi:hypothetical protein